jgi:transcriptional regulator with XRE-family HTH domain
MRYVDGKPYYTIAEVATACGVSAQTVREWERLGYFAASRSVGKHRLFSETNLREVSDRAAQRRRSRQVERTPLPLGDLSNLNWELSSTGARVRSAREAAGLTQSQLASHAGTSRSTLSAIERGLAGPSVQLWSRIAEALGIPMSNLAPPRPVGQILTTASQRPETLIAGVRWQELAAPGFSLAPGIMIADPNADSGGVITLSRENFVHILEGSMEFWLSPADDWIELDTGDSLMLIGGQAHAWRNQNSDVPARVLWIEQLAALPVEQSQVAPPAEEAHA